MDYLLKGMIGAAVVVVIGALTQSRFIYLAGLAPLFPTFSVIAHFLACQQAGAPGVKLVAWFGLFSILPYLAYLLTVLLFIDRWGFSRTLLTALVVWLAAAALITFIWNRTPLHRMVL